MGAYGYKGVARLRVACLQVSGIASLLLTSFGAAWLVAMAFQVGRSSYEGAGCVAVWLVVVGWAVGLAQINSAPDVWIEDEGLVVSAFLFLRVRIPWTEIEDVKTAGVPFGHTLVRARRITQFHRVYGWLYSRNFAPGFLIRRDIQNRDELLHEIRVRARQT